VQNCKVIFGGNFGAAAGLSFKTRFILFNDAGSIWGEKKNGLTKFSSGVSLGAWGEGYGAHNALQGVQAGTSENSSSATGRGLFITYIRS